MKAILDEGVPRVLAKALGSFGIETDPFPAVWAGMKNGVLIGTAEAAGYTVLVTNDKNMGFQQNLAGRTIAVVALPLNRRRLLLERLADIADTIRRATPSRHILMNLDGTRTSRGLVEGEAVIDALPTVATFKT